YYRKCKQLTQFQLAEAVGLNEKQISRIEAGQNYPTYMTFVKLIEVLEINIEEFTKKNKEKHNETKAELLGIINKANEFEVRIYHDIIIEEIFHTEDRENSKERSDDDFDDSVKNICHSVSVFIHSELSELTTRKYKKEFFEFLVNEYPVFSELNLDEDDKIVQHHLDKKEKEVKNTFNFVNPIFADDDLFSRVNLIQQYKTDNGMFAAFADRNNMQEDDFLDLQMKLHTLWGNSQSYNALLKKEEVIEFKNTAVRIYNRFYGKNHPEYEYIIFLAAWNAHEYFIEYLFWLDFVLKSYK
ncbi:MAG: helix-turn-helix transcriptional regulator, partial [Ruminococcus sp.]|nr:helix-turn-helix transcriptional regulator [Ruminococcus sp.]